MASAAARVHDAQNDGISDILHITARPAPAGHGLVEQNHRPVIIHALQIGKQAVQIISGPIDHR
jgi:hypothetical protein